MTTHANGFLADLLGHGKARQPATQHLTMCWELRDGMLVQVWRLAEGMRSRWPDVGEAPHPARRLAA